MLFRKSTLMITGLVAAGLLAAPAAHADWHGRGYGWHGGYPHWEHHHDNGGAAVAGALLGLGLGAIIGGAIASQPPAYYAPPPPVAYAPAPSYYAPPPGYYYAPYGYVQ